MNDAVWDTVAKLGGPGRCLTESDREAITAVKRPSVVVALRAVHGTVHRK